MTLVKNYLYEIPEAHVVILVYDKIDLKPILLLFLLLV